MRSLHRYFLLAGCLLSMVSGVGAQTELTVYTAVEPELLCVYKYYFFGKQPQININ